MLDFRKVLLALSVAGLGLVGTASAQVPSFTATGLQGYVAAEGTTEQLPTLTLTQTANTGTPTGAVTFLLTSNVPFVNQLVSGSTSKVDVVVTDGAGDTSTVTQPGPTTIQIAFSTLSAGQTININNLRVNASVAPISSSITVSVAATGVIVSTTAAVPLGFVSKALGTITVDPTGSAGATTTTSSCGLLKTTVFPVSNILIGTGFPDSLKAVSDSTTGNAMAQGTALAITFTNLNAGINYYAPSTIGAGSLVLAAYTAATGGVLATPVAAGSPGAGSILLTSASPTIYYLVTTSGGANTFSIPLALTASVPSVSAVTSFSTSPIGVSIVLGGPASPAYPGYSGGVTYTGTLASAANSNGLITPCSTTMLWPYVVNTNGFDTGFAIANASTLPAGVTGISASSGSCTVTFYGTGAATAAPIAYSYGTVATGTVGAAFALSGTPAAGITGYAVGVCNFVGAHGYAILLDSAGAGSVAANYLAIILSSGADVYQPAPSTFAATPTITPGQ